MHSETNRKGAKFFVLGSFVLDVFSVVPENKGSTIVGRQIW